jgi:signal transduction histidine kinase
MRWRIRSQLLIPLLTLLLGVVGISSWTAIASAQHARQRIELQMRDVARTVNEVSFPRNRWGLKLLHGLSEAEFLIDEGDGVFVTTFDISEKPGGLPLPADGWEDLRLGPRVELAGKPYLCSGVPMRQRADTDAVLYIFYPESLWRDALWTAVRPSLILGVFGGMASLVLTVGVARRLTRRVRELERRTRLIAAGDFSPMPLPQSNDEIRDLACSINEMALRLAQLQETMQKTERLRLLGQVSGGLAHQLRNGVTGARLAVQLHASECTGSGDAEALEVALRQLALIEANLKRFLALGRADAGRRERCTLTTILTEAIALLQPQCRHADIALSWHPPPDDMALIGDAGQLGQLFLNVIGNAVEAAGPHGCVEVVLHSIEGNAVIEVWDSGPGPSPDVASRLFEPFVTGKREGVGLGLAVARQIAEAHGGRITWRREKERTCFVMALPTESARVSESAKPRAAVAG